MQAMRRSATPPNAVRISIPIECLRKIKVCSGVAKQDLAEVCYIIVYAALNTGEFVPPVNVAIARIVVVAETLIGLV